MADHSAEIQKLESREAAIQSRLNKLNGPADSHLEGVAKHFHLGLVGGSGRNTHRLNQRRERSLERSIDNAKETTALYRELDEVQSKIKDLVNNGPEKRAASKADHAQILATYWRNLKAGDTINHGNGPVMITKKNKKSLATQGCAWSAAEIIGKQAADLL